MQTQSVYLDTEALAKHLGLTATALKEMRRRGDGPPWVKVTTKLVRYRLSDVEAWLTSRTVATSGK
jgi:predicted DNA-binding transcriptional regulator AlpA